MWSYRPFTERKEASQRFAKHGKTTPPHAGELLTTPLHSLVDILSVANTESLRVRVPGHFVRRHNPRSLPRILATIPPGGSPATSAFTLSRVSVTVPLFSAALIVLEYAAKTSAPVIS